MKNCLHAYVKLIAFIAIFCSTLPATADTLSNEAEISILTCSPGGELYSLFGHTAIRIKDPQQQLDVVFNYGTFDFATKGFYLKYAQGLLPYQLTYTSFRNFLNAYQQDNRTVYAQVLQLDSLEKQKMIDLLLENYRPENRSYLYNFLFDNCTTRSRDILEKSLPGSVEWHTTDADKSFWNLLDEYLEKSPWVQWGIHTILGQPGTHEATIEEYMFLPDYLMYGLDSATYNGQRLAQETEILYQAPDLNLTNPWYRSPFFIFAAGAFLLILLLQGVKNTKLLNTISMLLFAFSGIVGALIVFLGFFTEHPITAPNWNILWANPLSLIVLCFIPCKKMPGIIRKYLMLYIALLTIGIPAWFIAQPAVPLASISLIVLMLYLSFRLRNKK